MSWLTTQQLLASPMTQSSSNDPKPLTCDSTGFGFASIKDNLMSIGVQQASTWQTTSPSITCWLTIGKCIPITYTFLIMQIAFSTFLHATYSAGVCSSLGNLEVCRASSPCMDTVQNERWVSYLPVTI